MGSDWMVNSLDGAMAPSMGLLDGLSKAQQANSANIANANTPGYRAKQVSFETILNQQSSPMETSLSLKMGPSMLPQLIAPDGGKVNLQQEMLEMQKNLINFSLATKHLKTVITNVRTTSQVGR